MSAYGRTDRILERASRGEARPAEIEECIAETRTDLDRHLSALERRLSPDELVDQAIGYLRDGPMEFLSNLGQTVKANPVPVTLLSVGLGWLMLAGRSNGRHADSDWSRDDFTGEEGYEDLGRETGGVAGRIGDAARDQTRALSERGDHLADRVADLRHRASRASHDIGSQIGDVAGRAQRAIRGARDGMARAGSALERQPRRIREGYQDLANHHPLALGAIAFVAGAAIAASLRQTRFEDEAMGELRNRAVAGAEARARAGLRQGVESVENALNDERPAREENRTETAELTSGRADATPRETPGQDPHEHIH